MGECHRAIVIQTAGEGVLWDRDDDGCLQAGRNGSLGEGLVEDVGEHRGQLASTFLEYFSRYSVWAGSLSCVH